MKKKKTAIYTPETVREVYAAAKKNGTSVQEESEKRKLNFRSVQSAKYLLGKKKGKKSVGRKAKPKVQASFVDINIPQAPPQPQSDMVAVFMVPRSGIKVFMEELCR